MTERAVRQRGYDAKRRATQDWRHLYKSKRWARIKRAQAKAQPYCQECARLDPPRLFTPMTIVDHVDRHGGDPERFFRGPFQSLCKPCHDSRKQSEERRGFKLDMGPDGWPVDDRHPGNRDADGQIKRLSPQTLVP